MRRTALMIVASVLFVTTVAFAGVPGRFMHYPDINGDTVVFSYEGDLFSVSTAGGPARRLTNYPGTEDAADVALRRKLMEGGEAAVAASDDPMIVLARQLDPMRRELIHWIEDSIQGPEERAGEELGKARFAAFGKSTYPDATFTLRLSYGQVKGYPMNGTEAPPMTTFYGLYDRALGFEQKGPFALPARYAPARARLDLATPLNFVSATDVVGGNSGSPVINAKGEVVGAAFDGNIESLGGAFGFDDRVNRTVSVSTAAITEALQNVYGNETLAAELTGRTRR